MQALRFFETSVIIYTPMRCNNQEELNPQEYRCHIIYSRSLFRSCNTIFEMENSTGNRQIGRPRCVEAGALVKLVPDFYLRSMCAGYPRTSPSEGVPRDSVINTGPGDPGRIGSNLRVVGIIIWGS
jgi:hypothetical protein